jgi:hypothetical protein
MTTIAILKIKCLHQIGNENDFNEKNNISDNWNYILWL